MADLSAPDAVRATAGPLHNLGGRFMASRATFGRGAEWGWSNGLSFYVAGRGGVLGDVHEQRTARLHQLTRRLPQTRAFGEVRVVERGLGYGHVCGGERRWTKTSTVVL